MRQVVHLCHVAHHVGLVDVGGSDVYSLFIDGKQQFLLLSHLAIGLLCLNNGTHSREIVLRHLATSLVLGVLPHAYAFQFHVTKEDAVEIEGHVRTNICHQVSVVFLLVWCFLYSTEDVLLEVLIATKLCARHIKQGDLLAFEGDGFESIEEDGHILLVYDLLSYRFNKFVLQRTLIIAELAHQSAPLRRLGVTDELCQHRGYEHAVLHHIGCHIAVAQAALILTTAEIVHRIVFLYLSFVHDSSIFSSKVIYTARLPVITSSIKERFKSP